MPDADMHVYHVSPPELEPHTCGCRQHDAVGLNPRDEPAVCGVCEQFQGESSMGMRGKGRIEFMLRFTKHWSSKRVNDELQEDCLLCVLHTVYWVSCILSTGCPGNVRYLGYSFLSIILSPALLVAFDVAEESIGSSVEDNFVEDVVDLVGFGAPTPVYLASQPHAEGHHDTCVV